MESSTLSLTLVNNHLINLFKFYLMENQNFQTTTVYIHEKHEAILS